MSISDIYRTENSGDNDNFSIKNNTLEYENISQLESSFD